LCAGSSQQLYRRFTVPRVRAVNIGSSRPLTEQAGMSPFWENALSKLARWSRLGGIVLLGVAMVGCCVYPHGRWRGGGHHHGSAQPEVPTPIAAQAEAPRG
jgi:hypothetical protein